MFLNNIIKTFPNQGNNTNICLHIPKKDVSMFFGKNKATARRHL